MKYVKPSEDVYVTETVYDRDTGLRTFQRTTFNGLRQSPPDDSPSEIVFDKLGRPQQLEWHHKDELHRTTGPATVFRNTESGIHTSERFYTAGRPRDPLLGPQVIRRDSRTGEIKAQGRECDMDYETPFTKPANTPKPTL